MKVVVLDLETTGLDWRARILCVSRAVCVIDEHNQVAVEVSSLNLGMVDMFSTAPATTPEARAWVQETIANADWVAGHNLSFDLPLMARDGMLELGQLSGRVYDTLLMARCTGSHDSIALEALAAEYGIPFNSPEDERFYAKMKSKRASLEGMSSDSVMRYCELDVRRNLALFFHLKALSDDQYKEDWVRAEGDYVLLVCQMRKTGMPLDVQRILQIMDSKKKQIAEINKRLVTWSIRGANDAAGLLALADRFMFRKYLRSTDKGNTSLDEESLLSVPGVREWMDLRHVEELDEKQARLVHMLKESGYVLAIADVLDGREISKQISTWLQGFLDQADDRGWIHPLWGAGGTVSYRLNCTEPNAQAVTKRLRLWGCPPGYVLGEYDLSQAELRLGAAYAAEDKMARYFHDGIDFHDGTTMDMFGIRDMAYLKTPEGKLKRRQGKTANFGGFYGGGARALDNALHIGLSAAEKIVRMWRTTFKNVAKAGKDAEGRWRTRGYVILSWGKRLWASPDDLSRRIYKAFNQLIQGSIAEIIKTAMLRIAVEHPTVLIIGQIHDSILVLIPIDEAPTTAPAIRDLVAGSTPAWVLQRTNPPIVMVCDMDLYDEHGPVDVVDGQIKRKETK